MKKSIISFILIVSVLTAGCSSSKPEDCIGAYMTVINKLFNEDKALNDGIKYMAIDTSSMSNLDEESKNDLLKQLEKEYYGTIILDMTFEELKSNGYIKDLFFPDGIFFKIEDSLIKNNSIEMNVSKWRSGTGAIGYDNLIIKYSDSVWKITDTGTAWIS